jgi:hypothetical protein
LLERKVVRRDRLPHARVPATRAAHSGKDRRVLGWAAGRPASRSNSEHASRIARRRTQLPESRMRTHDWRRSQYKTFLLQFNLSYRFAVKDQGLPLTDSDAGPEWKTGGSSCNAWCVSNDPSAPLRNQFRSSSRNHSLGTSRPIPLLSAAS